ncbi:MAG: TonB family protein [Nitrospira sp.]
MAGYTGYHTNRNSWSAATIVGVVVAHLILAVGVYQISQTEYVQDLIKVSKLVTVKEPIREPVKPPEAPPPPPEIKPEPKPAPPLEPPPMEKELPPEPVSIPEEASPAPSSVEERRDFKAVETAPVAIGKPRHQHALYEDLLAGSIQAVYQQPPELPDSLEYAVLCQLEMDEEGYILAYKLLSSSGNAIFDRSAQQALSRLRQVRPPPPGMSRTVVVKFFPP